MSIEVALCTTNHHAKTPRWLAFPQNISLKTQKSPKTKMINRIPKMEAKHRSPQCHWLPSTGFRGFKIQILIKFTVRPSHVKPKPSTKTPKAHTWSMAFCCSDFNVSMSKCTNPCYMTHRVLKAQMNCCINQNSGQKITFKSNRSSPMPLAACHSFSKSSNSRYQ